MLALPLRRVVMYGTRSQLFHGPLASRRTEECENLSRVSVREQADIHAGVSAKFEYNGERSCPFGRKQGDTNTHARARARAHTHTHKERERERERESESLRTDPYSLGPY